MGQPVTHFEVHGKDAAALNAFYGELFGWHVDSNNPMNYGLVDTHGGERGINGGIAPDDESWVTFYVEVDDLQAALDKAEKLGGTNVLRADEQSPCLPVEEALAAAPEVESDRFKVPRVVEME